MTDRVRRDISYDPALMRQVTVKVNALEGVNLGQGLCLLDPPDAVLEGARKAISDGFNVCPPMDGVAPLREQVLKRVQDFNKINCDAGNLLITAGATAAFETICQTLINPGDEVILFSPLYPFHLNPLQRSRAKIKTVDLMPPKWSFDLEQLEKQITPATKFVLLNSPHNPTGKVFTKEELISIGKLCLKHDILCVTDEVYECMTYDGYEPVSLASFPEFKNNCIMMGSFSKTFAITGWRVGYMLAPDSIVDAFKSVSDFVYLGSPTPLQHGVAYALENVPASYYSELNKTYLKKRSLLANALEAGGLPYFQTQGAYYLVVDTRERFPGKSSLQAVTELVEKVGVGAVPAEDFLLPEHRSDLSKANFLRFSFAVPDSMIEAAAERLKQL
ncbi:MAG: pyridoxal phosphate-dependent aminotransferase [Deltaproteobacteria bacterium]|nr:pyridoxal phosphate-dependent aminotransferase [Deltaproteobacteria bacterium]